MRRRSSLSAAEARRITLAAQGLADGRPNGRIDRRHLRRVMRHVGLVQLDSVNVLVRAHELTLFSRLGPHDRSLLPRVAYEDRELVEYWGHEASLLRAELRPLLRWRMAQEHRWRGMRSFARDHADHLAALLDAVRTRGPVGARELDTPGGRTGPWWGWSATKRGLEHLFWRGDVGALRSSGFERLYCDPADAVPTGVLDQPTPTVDEAHRSLLRIALRGHGVGTAADLADYFRLHVPTCRSLLTAMAADGEIDEVDVEGWRGPAYLDPEARLPRRIDARALVSPFDSAMWHRDRVERVHGFRYRIEIYVPAAERVHGYYVLPFLLGDRFAARVDLKADRTGRRLLVRSAFAEPGTDPPEVARALGDELRLLANWLELDDVVVERRGDLAPEVAAATS